MFSGNRKTGPTALKKVIPGGGASVAKLEKETLVTVNCGELGWWVEGVEGLKGTVLTIGDFQQR